MSEPCPVDGCRKTCYTPAGLGLHLYESHNKSELINAILKLREILRKGEDLDKTTQA